MVEESDEKRKDGRKEIEDLRISNWSYLIAILIAIIFFIVLAILLSVFKI